MNILEAREAAMAGKTVISPSGREWAIKDFDNMLCLDKSFIFGEWSVEVETIVFEADVGHLNMSDCVVMYCESLRHLIGKRVKVTVEAIDEA